MTIFTVLQSNEKSRVNSPFKTYQWKRTVILVSFSLRGKKKNRFQQNIRISIFVHKIVSNYSNITTGFVAKYTWKNLKSKLRIYSCECSTFSNNICSDNNKRNNHSNENNNSNDSNQNNNDNNHIENFVVSIRNFQSKTRYWLNHWF